MLPKRSNFVNVRTAADIPEGLEKLVQKRIAKVESGCWLWTWVRKARRLPTPPAIAFGAKIYNPARVLWVLKNGDITPDVNLISFCGNCECICPEHRMPATPSTRCRLKKPAQTRIRRRAYLRPEAIKELRKIGRPKGVRLEPSDSVKRLLNAIAGSQKSQSDLARELGVSRQYISWLKKRHLSHPEE
jgi:hypothetical protein